MTTIRMLGAYAAWIVCGPLLFLFRGDPRIVMVCLLPVGSALIAFPALLQSSRRLSVGRPATVSASRIYLGVALLLASLLAPALLGLAMFGHPSTIGYGFIICALVALSVVSALSLMPRTR